MDGPARQRRRGWVPAGAGQPRVGRDHFFGAAVHTHARQAFEKCGSEMTGQCIVGDPDRDDLCGLGAPAPLALYGGAFECDDSDKGIGGRELLREMCTVPEAVDPAGAAGFGSCVVASDRAPGDAAAAGPVVGQLGQRQEVSVQGDPEGTQPVNADDGFQARGIWIGHALLLAGSLAGIAGAIGSRVGLVGRSGLSIGSTSILRSGRPMSPMSDASCDGLWSVTRRGGRAVRGRWSWAAGRGSGSSARRWRRPIRTVPSWLRREGRPSLFVT